jgi:hypothetical protein
MTTYRSIDICGKEWHLKNRDYSTEYTTDHIEGKLDMLLEAINDLYDEIESISILLNKD